MLGYEEMSSTDNKHSREICIPGLIGCMYDNIRRDKVRNKDNLAEVGVIPSEEKIHENCLH